MTTITEIFFFIILFLSYIFFFIITNHFGLNTTSGKVILLVLSIFGTLALIGYSYATNLFKERFKENIPIDGRYCQGGKYLFQGSDERSKMCRALASTPGGMTDIQRFNCGKGFTGYPVNRWIDTSMSNGCWENEMCNSPSSNNIENNGIF